MEKTLKTVMSFQGDAATQLSSSKSLAKPSNLASKGEEVESAKAEMSQVREENTRLKMLLEKIESEYKSLKMRVEDNYSQQPEKIKNNELVSTVEDDESEHDQLISLCLGTNRKNVSKKLEEELKICSNNGLNLGLANYDDQKSKLQVAFPHLNSSPDNNKEGDAAGETWLANKGLKAMRSSTGDHQDDVSQVINNVKRARVSVRARCTTPTMNDGCQWRKYGQKIAKSNPCPRAYYRCTVAASCPVRKQVQRCAEDTSILITTYEGTHNHPLPISATAMASTTSAAACMLLSGSSSSLPPPNLTSSTFHGFNINNPNSSRPFYMSNPSSSPPFPTITLDLTASPPSTSSSPFNIAAAHGLYPFTGLGYSHSYSNVLPTIWDSSTGNLAYGNGTTPFLNRTQNLASFHTGRPPQEQLFQSAMKKYELMSSSGSSSSSHQVLTETLTRAITSDPNFRSVIAAAISTMNGGGSSAHDQSNSNVEMLDRNLKWDEQEKSTVRIPSPPAAHQAI